MTKEDTPKNIWISNHTFGMQDIKFDLWIIANITFQKTTQIVNLSLYQKIRRLKLQQNLQDA